MRQEVVQQLCSSPILIPIVILYPCPTLAINKSPEGGGGKGTDNRVIKERGG